MEFSKTMRLEFEMSMMGELISRTQIKQGTECSFISQCKDTGELLKTFASKILKRIQHQWIHQSKTKIKAKER